MISTIALIAPGSMGAAIGGRLADHGINVVTSLTGRSADSIRRARAAGMQHAEDDEIAAADFILSIVPPGTARQLADRLAPALERATVKPIYVDCNAVSPETVMGIAAVIAETGCKFADAGIIGAPPRADHTPTIYVSGEAATAFAELAQHGLLITRLDGGAGVASALKMVYAGISKGVLALGTSMFLAAARAGVADPLRGELAASQPALLQLFDRLIPTTYSKAYRWVAEMEEIAAFGEPASAGIAEIYRGIAKLYQALAADFATEQELISTLRQVVGPAARPVRGD
jgi:3-hydroxyisobutyrate dehydrogenase-like beta-hydroxyacid dehydrogenase